MGESKQELSIEEQIYLLICKFANRSKVISLMGESHLNIEDIKQEFINTAYIYFCERSLPKFDSSLSKLSTYVYTFLDWQYTIFITMAKYSVSYKVAQLIVNGNGSEDRKQRSRKVYSDYLSYDVKIDEEDTNDSTYQKVLEELSVPFNDNLDSEYVIDTFIHSIDRYLKSSHAQSKSRNKEIILSYFLDNDIEDKVTYQSLANKYNVSRQYVHMTIKRYCEWAERDSAIRTAFNK